MTKDSTSSVRNAGTLASAALIAAVMAILKASPASAPEPAKLNGPLNGYVGQAASATYVTSQTPTTAYQWPGSWVVNSTIPAGTPCSTSAVVAGTTVTSVIQRMGNYAKCS